MAANGWPPQGEKETNVEPRETARQIAEQVVNELAEHVFVLKNAKGGVEAGIGKPAFYLIISKALASLTADLAQARQENDRLQPVIASLTHRLGLMAQDRNDVLDQLLEARRKTDAAEQARDEALADARSLRNTVARLTGEPEITTRAEALAKLRNFETLRAAMPHEAQLEVAARTALLEAAEDAGKWIELPDAQKLYLYAHGDRKQVIEWLKARAEAHP